MNFRRIIALRYKLPAFLTRVRGRRLREAIKWFEAGLAGVGRRGGRQQPVGWHSERFGGRSAAFFPESSDTLSIRPGGQVGKSRDWRSGGGISGRAMSPGEAKLPLVGTAGRHGRLDAADPGGPQGQR